MICAVYARKSNDQNGVADEAKSVARQIEHARAYAERKGWTVSDEHVFVDDGVSGAEFANRPGFVRLMAAATAKRPMFKVLVMSEESRLGREMIEVSYSLKQIVMAGIRVFYYLEDRERTLDSPTDKVMLALNAFASEVEREMARQRSRDAARQRAAHGYVTGGATFGYRNVRTDTGRVAREIDAAEARVVVRIFEMARDGKGGQRIAAVLNAEGAPSPRAQQGRPNGWVASSVRAVLYRDLYRGVVVWGKVAKRDKWGLVKNQPKPETAWVRTDVPHLRIVDEALWDAAHDRLGSSRAYYLRHTDGKLWGKPANGIESKYLLVGLARCGECGGGMQVYPRTHGSPGKRKRVHVYGCPRAKVDRCTNDIEVPMTIADEAALGMIADEVLTEDIIDLTIDRVIGMLDGTAEDTETRRAMLTRELKTAETELANLVSLAASEPSDAIVKGIRERERRQKILRAELAAMERGPALRAEAEAIRTEARRVLADWRGLLGEHVATSRQLLRKLLDRERFVFYPKRHAGHCWYDLGVTPSVDRFLASVDGLKKAVASLTGFEPVFWP